MSKIAQRKLNVQIFYAYADYDVRGDISKVVELLKAGVDVNYYIGSECGTTLNFMVNRGSLKAVQIFLAYGANPDGNDDITAPLFWCSNTEYGLSIAKELLDYGASINVTRSGRKEDTPLKFYIEAGNFEVAKLIIKRIAEREVAGLDVSKENLELKNKLKDPFQQEDYNSDIASSYKESFDKCKEEVKKLEKESKPLYDFLKESDINKLVTIWEKNENVQSKFDDPDSLKEQYPEYARMLINKANDVKKTIFRDNHLLLINPLRKIDYNGNNTRDRIETFLEENKDKLKVHFGAKKHTLIDFVDSGDFKRHVPTLQFQAAISIVNSNLDKLKTEQHRKWRCTIL